MTKTFSLQPLLDLTQHQTESASRKLGQLNQKQQSCQQQLDTLLAYRKDYLLRLQQAEKNGIEPATLRNYQQFIAKLDEAIRQQRQTVDNSTKQVQHGRQEYQETQRKLKSYNTLEQRFWETQQKAAEKIEQKMLDEHTGRIVGRKMQQSVDE